MDNSIEQRIMDLKMASASWLRAADDYQSAKMLDDMLRCRAQGARLSEMVAILREQKVSYWRATIAPDLTPPQS
jgi:hypothetical protein